MIVSVLFQCPSFDPMCDLRGPIRPVYSKKELEQVVVLILLGKDLVKDWGSFLRELVLELTPLSHYLSLAPCPKLIYSDSDFYSPSFTTRNVSRKR